LKKKSILAILLTVISLSALALDQEKTPTSNPVQIYGSQLMTQQEREIYRTTIRKAKNAEEADKIRKEHHEKMQIRAKESGVTLPDDPPVRGGGGGSSRGGMGLGGQSSR
jgi:hypothetical protein